MHVQGPTEKQINRQAVQLPLVPHLHVHCPQGTMYMYVKICLMAYIRATGSHFECLLENTTIAIMYMNVKLHFAHKHCLKITKAEEGSQ